MISQFFTGPLLTIQRRLRCDFAQFKLCAHLLNLLGLLFELGCESLCLLSELGYESLYLFLLLRDCFLQLLNFIIAHGLVLELGALARLRCATTRRCATLHRYTTTLVRARIIPKVVVCKVQSNLNNGGAVNRLEVREDTTDEAG